MWASGMLDFKKDNISWMPNGESAGMNRRADWLSPGAGRLGYCLKKEQQINPAAYSLS
jgi:hypothetical protein